jgi:hypothetical protein
MLQQIKEKEKMTRAERRRLQREEKSKTATYNLTRAQLDALIKEEIKKDMENMKQEITDDAVNTAMVLLLTLPMKVLMDHYWTKTAHKRIPLFTERILEYYDKWLNNELDMDELQRELWEYGGVKLMEGDGN